MTSSLFQEEPTLQLHFLNISVHGSREGKCSVTGALLQVLADMHSTSQPEFGLLDFEMSLVGQVTTTGVIVNDTAVSDQD